MCVGGCPCVYLTKKQGPFMHLVVSAFPIPAFSLYSFFQVPGELNSEVETSPDFLFLILSFSRLGVSCAPNGACCPGLRGIC